MVKMRQELEILNEFKGNEHKTAGYEAARNGASRWSNPNEKESKPYADWKAGHETFKANQKMSHSWADGFSAARDGKTKVINPHGEGSQLYHSWNKGFEDFSGKNKNMNEDISDLLVEGQEIAHLHNKSLQHIAKYAKIIHNHETALKSSKLEPHKKKFHEEELQKYQHHLENAKKIADGLHHIMTTEPWRKTFEVMDKGKITEDISDIHSDASARHYDVMARGYKAAAQGKAVETNPHKVGTQNHSSWIEGHAQYHKENGMNEAKHRAVGYHEIEYGDDKNPGIKSITHISKEEAHKRLSSQSTTRKYYGSNQQHDIIHHDGNGNWYHLDHKTHEPNNNKVQRWNRQLNEDNWIHTDPNKRGMFDGKDLSDLTKQKNNLKAHHDSLTSQGKEIPEDEKTKMHELEFAIRAKKGHGFTNEEIVNVMGSEPSAIADFLHEAISKRAYNAIQEMKPEIAAKLVERFKDEEDYEEAKERKEKKKNIKASRWLKNRQQTSAIEKDKKEMNEARKFHFDDGYNRASDNHRNLNNPKYKVYKNPHKEGSEPHKDWQSGYDKYETSKRK